MLKKSLAFKIRELGTSSQYAIDIEGIVSDEVACVIVGSGELIIHIKGPELRKLIARNLKIELPENDGAENLKIMAPYQTNRVRKGAIVIRPEGGGKSPAIARLLTPFAHNSKVRRLSGWGARDRT